MGEPELKAKLGFPTATHPARLFAWLLGVVQHRMEGDVSYILYIYIYKFKK